MKKSKIIKTLRASKALMAEAIFLVYYESEYLQFIPLTDSDEECEKSTRIHSALEDTIYQISAEIDELEICKQNFFQNVFSIYAWEFYNKNGIRKIYFLKNSSLEKLIESIADIIITINENS